MRDMHHTFNIKCFFIIRKIKRWFFGQLVRQVSHKTKQDLNDEKSGCTISPFCFLKGNFNAIHVRCF